MIVVHIDGSCDNARRGQMGWAAVIRRDGEMLARLSGRSPANRDNSSNRAEYLGLRLALEWLWLLSRDMENPARLDEVEIRSDSMLVVKQMTDRWRIKDPGRYAPIARECRRLAQRFAKIRFKWIPRLENQEADALAGAYEAECALDESCAVGRSSG